MLRFIEVPEHGRAVFAAGRAKRTVRGDGNGVDISSVADVISLDTAGSELPDLLISSHQFSRSPVEPSC